VYVLAFAAVDRADVARVGGKGANLAELSRIDGVRVPDGFCVTTAAFDRMKASAPGLDALLDGLTRGTASAAAIRAVIEATPVPDDVRDAIAGAVAGLGAQTACAVRSSATAEDLPGASFAGQQDSFLDVVGEAAIVEHVRRCWASLFTERAVAYRARNGFEHRAVRMAVVVQVLLVPQASGVLFTADPVTGNRKRAAIEAVPGRGDAFASGRVGAVPELLTDAQRVELEAVGRRVEAHFGEPQDIEWCLVDGGFQLVQTRPITTIYPIPQPQDGTNRVYLSVGHQQMMTDAMKPLGLSLFQLTAARPMFEAGGRLFVDVTQQLAATTSRDALLDLAGRSDPLIRDALQNVLSRGDFVATSADPPRPPGAGGRPPELPDDPAIPAGLIARSEAAIDTLKRDIASRSGTDLLDFVLQDVERMRQGLTDPQSMGAILAGMNAATWINEHMLAWLGEKNAADTLSQSVPNNVTSEMGLALLDVADAIRPHPAVVAYLRDAEDDGFLDGLATVDGGPRAREALVAFLDRYGMRCVGEIDVTRPRWSESPTTLVPLILGNLESFAPGAAGRKLEQGLREAAAKERDLLERLEALPDGEAAARTTKAMIHRLRTFTGYREYPKYGIVCRFFVYKQALLAEADRLVRAGVLRARDDLDWLTLPELREVVRTQALDPDLVRRRKAEHERNRRLAPPRVLTSDGESVAGAYDRADVPAGALVGLAVSAGVVEGRARVLSDLGEAALEPGDVLVTAFTDPSWTPAFVSIAALVTEVGGRMTHGAVIAREYGLPAVIGVLDATRRIRDGQRVRVHGTDGYVELLD
jgi:phosphoenolpyruvate synthase/pyruvate phosphate dikinase